jgi:hypothetical protein
MIGSCDAVLQLRVGESETPLALAGSQNLASDKQCGHRRRRFSRPWWTHLKKILSTKIKHKRDEHLFRMGIKPR